jgi:hypothetical protein
MFRFKKPPTAKPALMAGLPKNFAFHDTDRKESSDSVAVGVHMGHGDSDVHADSDNSSKSPSSYVSIIDYYDSERDMACLHVCAVVCKRALQESTRIMDDVWDGLLRTVSAHWLSATSDPVALVNRAVKLVCGPGHKNISLAKHFTAESIRKWLLLAERPKAILGTPAELACTALCGKLTDDLLRELEELAGNGYEELKSGFGYEEALRQGCRGVVKLPHTYRRMLEGNALRLRMQGIEVVIGPDALTVCQKIAKLEDMRFEYDLLKGIVLPEGCRTCQLVVQLPHGMGAVVTQPVSDPRHIAAYLVLTLQYSGKELLRLLEQWHFAAAGVPLHPDAGSTEGVALVGEKAESGALEEVIERHPAGEDDDDRDSLCRDDFVV